MARFFIGIILGIILLFYSSISAGPVTSKPSVKRPRIQGRV